MKRLNWNSLIAVPLFPALLVCLISAGLQAEEDSEPDNTEATAATSGTHEVKSGRLQLKLELDGAFESGQSVAVSLRPKAWTKLEVKQAQPHGTAVKQGDSLVELDLEDLHKAITVARLAVLLGELNLEEARVTLEELRKTTPIDLASSERAAQEAVADLEYFLKVTKGRSRKSAEFSLRNAQYSLEYAQEELNQLRQMYKADDLTEETEEIILKRAERGVISAQFSLESRELATKKTLETDLPRQEQALKDATGKQAAGVRRAIVSLAAAMKKADLALEKQILEQKTAAKKLQDLQSDLKRLSSVTSPIDGYVYYGRVRNGAWTGKGTLDAALQPGGNLTPRQVFITVVAPGAVRMHTSVAEKDLFQIRAGLTGKATATAFPDSQFDATVESVSPVPAGPGAFHCVVSIAGAVDSRILSGMKGSVTIVTYDRKKAVSVPGSAVFTDEDSETKHVFVVSGEGSEQRTVRTGRTQGDNIEILEGLKPGDVILLKKPQES